MTDAKSHRHAGTRGTTLKFGGDVSPGFKGNPYPKLKTPRLWPTFFGGTQAHVQKQINMNDIDSPKWGDAPQVGRGASCPHCPPPPPPSGGGCWSGGSSYRRYLTKLAESFWVVPHTAQNGSDTIVLTIILPPTSKCNPPPLPPPPSRFPRPCLINPTRPALSPPRKSNALLTKTLCARYTHDELQTVIVLCGTKHV